MKAAACSWRHRTNPMLLDRSEIIRSAFSSPGTPNICVTPSASKHRTNTSDAFSPALSAWSARSDIVVAVLLIRVLQVR